MKREEALKRFYETMRMMRYSHKTIKAYTDWIEQFITFLFSGKAGATRDNFSVDLDGRTWKTMGFSGIMAVLRKSLCKTKSARIC
jgi:hypothetical protein